MVEHLTKDLGVTKIAIMYQDDAFGQAGLAGVKKALDKRQMQLAGEGTFERNTVAVLAGWSACSATMRTPIALILPSAAMFASITSAGISSTGISFS